MGGEAEYLVGVSLSRAFLIKPARTGKAETFVLSFEGTSSHCHEIYGAGFYFNEHVYFACNAGEGVFEVMSKTIDIAKGTVVVERVGLSKLAARNDGMSCHR